MSEREPLIPAHGGYRKLKGFQVAQLAYDVTVLFAEKYVDRFSRTRDQMACLPKPRRRQVQAARSGVQNIAEGSQASATSKKTELKLTQVARASLEELRLDYEDFLRQRSLPTLAPDDPVLLRFKAQKPETLEAFRAWVAEERKRSRDEHGLAGAGHAEKNVKVGGRPCPSLSSACLAANGALSLLNLACWLLDRQVAQLAEDFENKGGFTERLYRVRKNRKGGQ